MKTFKEGDARGGGIKLGMSGKMKDGKKIKVLKKLGKKTSDGFLCSIDGEEKEMHPGEMNKIRWIKESKDKVRLFIEIIEAQDKNEKGDKEAYQKFFDKTLKKFGVDSPEDLSPEKKKEFFDVIDAGWKADKETD
jgi:hypothetical protein